MAELPSAVATFDKLCLVGGLDPAARPAALSAAGWQKAAVTDIDVPKLGISKAIDRNFDFSKPSTTEQWNGTVDGRPASVVLARFDPKRRYLNLCALTVNGVRNAMPYGDDLSSAFEAFGVKGKSVDLAHYYEYAGKVGSDKHPVRGEIFTRSLATGGRDAMHIYVAY
ncbi:hypothetical protein [Sphingomonas sp. BK580]|uniref:hypothetical protein n=1 Tax=Sphingomonas sp. BK580 TaxID=2586972 RepID=UPI0016092AA6|nr:hypothetical protein [Sphingomonas sp. BK580]MBB3694801.1 hypothetical protein [Sphingomonas sp. BK580]